MPQWLKIIFVRKAAVHALQDRHEHEWAEFNLPADADLQALREAWTVQRAGSRVAKGAFVTVA